MGLNLKMVPLFTDKIHDVVGDYTCLHIEREYDFFSQLTTERLMPYTSEAERRELPAQIVFPEPLPATVKVVAIGQKIVTITKEYRDAYEITTAGELKKLKLTSSCAGQDFRAAMAYIHALNDNCLVILLWS